MTPSVSSVSSLVDGPQHLASQCHCQDAPAPRTLHAPALFWQNITFSSKTRPVFLQSPLLKPEAHPSGSTHGVSAGHVHPPAWPDDPTGGQAMCPREACNCFLKPLSAEVHVSGPRESWGECPLAPVRKALTLEALGFRKHWSGSSSPKASICLWSEFSSGLRAPDAAALGSPGQLPVGPGRERAFQAGVQRPGPRAPAAPPQPRTGLAATNLLSVSLACPPPSSHHRYTQGSCWREASSDFRPPCGSWMRQA
ncbi:unnamed protein product [Rangifer tarandus platyrhynchus]|uniref:Uncharacterized protein n=1 Tax=Rangifer tarandus platyrhynchus TaxID=3082113 RepID=A0AC59Z2X8_RANTA